MKELIQQINKYIKIEESHYISTSLEDFKESYLEIKSITRNSKGIIMISENIAVICFDSADNLKIKVKSNRKLSVEDFSFCDDGNLLIIGAKQEKQFSTIRCLIDDLKRNGKIIFLLAFIYFWLFNSKNASMESLNSLADILINISSIFIATVFVFIGMFYGNKERAISLYKKGRCDTEYETDKYVILLSLLALLLQVISYSISEIEYIEFSNDIFNNICVLFSFMNEYDVCMVLVFISIVLLLICFESLVNYYLRTCRNEFFVDAINDIVEERKKNRKK